MSVSKRKCYVIMPFSKMGTITKRKWDEIYEHLFRPAVDGAELSYICERSRIRNGAFTKDILENLQDAHVVLADLTGFNPNVMWELGIRHTLSNRTILVCRENRKVQKIISDIGIYGVVYYKPNLTGRDEFSKEIKHILEDIDKDPNRSDNPVYDFLKQEDFILGSFERKIVINKMTGLLTELFKNLDVAEMILEGGEESLGIKNVILRRYSVDAINHLLTTNYVSTHPTYLKMLKDFTVITENVNKELDYLMFTNYDNKGSREIILKNSADMKKEIEQAIPWTEHIIEHIKKGDPVFGDSPILVMDDKHKMLLKDPKFAKNALKED